MFSPKITRSTICFSGRVLAIDTQTYDIEFDNEFLPTCGEDNLIMLAYDKRKQLFGIFLPKYDDMLLLLPLDLLDLAEGHGAYLETAKKLCFGPNLTEAEVKSWTDVVDEIQAGLKK